MCVERDMTRIKGGEADNPGGQLDKAVVRRLEEIYRFACWGMGPQRSEKYECSMFYFYWK